MPIPVMSEAGSLNAKSVTLNLFQGLNFGASQSKMLKQVQHDDIWDTASAFKPSAEYVV